MFLSDFIKSIGLEEKGNWTTTIVVSSTGPLCNAVTINCEGSESEDELVYKTFDTAEGVIRSQKHMASTAGYPTTAEEYKAPDSAAKLAPAKKR